MKNVAVLLLLFSSVFVSSCTTGKKLKKQPENRTLTQAMKYKESDLFTQAVILHETGKPEEALQKMSEALAIDPGDPAANYQEAKILLDLARTDEALTYAKKAATLDPRNKWYKQLYADLEKANGNYREYLSAYEELVKQYPDDPNLVNELAFAYLFTGDYKNALVYFKKIEKREGKNEMLTAKIADLYSRIGEPQKGAQEYDNLINSFPDEKRYYAMKAEYCVKNNLPQCAEQSYKKILSLDPQDPYVHISLSDFYRKNNKPEKSFEELKLGFENPKLDLRTKINLLLNYYSGTLTDEMKKQALELSEILKKVHPDEGLSEAFYANMLFQNKKFSQAEKIIKKILKTNRSNYSMWEQLLFCELYLNKYDTLIMDADSAIEFFPNQPIPYYLGGVGAFQKKEYEKARKFLEAGKDLVVNNNALLERFYSTLGDTYNELKMYPESYAAYDKALEINPDNALVLNNYAYYLSLRSEQLEKAEKMAKKAVQLDPYNENNLDTYAWVFYKMKKYKEALNWEKKAIANGGADSGIILEHTGDIYYRLGKKDKAFEYWYKALTKDDYSDLLIKKITDKKLYE